MANEIASKVHSELGASSYYRWKECPGSVALCRTVPKRASSVYADEGTKAHEIAAAILIEDPYSHCEAEVLESVLVYVRHCQDLIKQGFICFVEQRFDLSRLIDGCFGTADFVAYDKENKYLYVVDYKHGAGVPVEVEENSQLIFYGLGALIQNKFPVSKVILTIVQPRCYHTDGPVRSWSTTPDRMTEFLLNLSADAEKTINPNAPLVTGDHCRWCDASAVCPKQHEENTKEAQSAFALTTTSESPNSPTSYDPQKLGDTLRALDRIEDWAKSVRAFAYEEAIAGRPPPGFKLVDKRPSRKWREGCEEEIEEHFKDYDIYEKPTLLSPSKLEKVLPKKCHEAMWQFVIKESSGKKLAPIDDDRPEYNPAIEAKKVFEITN